MTHVLQSPTGRVNHRIEGEFLHRNRIGVADAHQDTTRLEAFGIGKVHHADSLITGNQRQGLQERLVVDRQMEHGLGRSLHTKRVNHPGKLGVPHVDRTHERNLVPIALGALLQQINIVRFRSGLAALRRRRIDLATQSEPAKEPAWPLGRPGPATGAWVNHLGMTWFCYVDQNQTHVLVDDGAQVARIAPVGCRYISAQNLRPAVLKQEVQVDGRHGLPRGHFPANTTYQSRSNRFANINDRHTSNAIRHIGIGPTHLNLLCVEQG